MSDLNPKKNIQWLEEWKEFSQDSPVFTRTEISADVLNQIQKDLHPTRAQVWSKLIAIHGITGLISLFFCPQMGVGGWMTDLVNVFMALGHSVCFVLCGAFFMGGGFLMAQLFLEKEELRKIRQDRLILLPGLTILSFGILKMLSTQSLGGHHHSPNSLTVDALLWMFGAFLVGWLFFKPKSVLPS